MSPSKSKTPREGAYLTAALFVDRLQARYPPREYAFLTQVHSNTGGPPDRTADAMVFSLWPSRGLTVTGFEIKCYGGDWRRELRNPEKAERIARYCDFWWIVANAGVVPVEELPINWGLMIPSADGLSLVKVRDAAKLNPAPLDRAFIAGVFRNIGDSMVPRASVAAQLEEAKKAGVELGVARSADGREIERLQRIEAAAKEFERASGLSIAGDWRGLTAKTIGETIRLLVKGDQDLAYRLSSLEHFSKTAKEIAGDVKTQVERLRAAALEAKILEPKELV